VIRARVRHFNIVLIFAPDAKKGRTCMAKKDIPFEIKEKFVWTDIILGIFFFLSLLALGLLIAINFRPLYYWNIDWLDLEQNSGFSAAVIKENYDALIDYCSPFCFRELWFPSIPASVSGLSHFAEVKSIFNAVYITGLGSLVITVLWFIRKARNREKKYLKICGIVTLVIPVLLLIGSAINFEAIFLAFHRIVFSNEDWIFNPITDPVINILPETYFMECAIIIAGVIIIGAVTVLIIYLKKRGRKHDESLIPGKKNYVY